MSHFNWHAIYSCILFETEAVLHKLLNNTKITGLRTYELQRLKLDSMWE
jgi:hypothetical protein